jgi:integrase
MMKNQDSPSIAFWLKKSAGSPRTEYLYRNVFALYARKNGLDAEAIVSEWRTVKYDYAERERFLDRHMEILERYAVSELCRLTPKGRQTELAAILSFYHHNKIPLEADIKERIYVVNHNRAIKKEEILRILEHASLRDRCFFLMMLESGLRPLTLCLLRYRNIKTDFEAGRVPMKIDLESKILKDNVSARWTFIGEDGFKCLKEYLAPRIPLKNDDVLFLAVHSKLQKGEALSPSLFSTCFGDIVKKLGWANKGDLKRFRNELNLYTLRKYFRNNMKVSDPAFREFWMCHSLGVDSHYFEANLDDPQTVERHRAEYAKGYPSLRVYSESLGEDTKAQISVLQSQNKELREQIGEMLKDWEKFKPLAEYIGDLEVQEAVQKAKQKRIMEGDREQAEREQKRT